MNRAAARRARRRGRARTRDERDCDATRATEVANARRVEARGHQSSIINHNKSVPRSASRAEGASRAIRLIRTAEPRSVAAAAAIGTAAAETIAAAIGTAATAAATGIPATAASTAAATEIPAAAAATAATAATTAAPTAATTASAAAPTTARTATTASAAAAPAAAPAARPRVARLFAKRRRIVSRKQPRRALSIRKVLHRPVRAHDHEAPRVMHGVIPDLERAQSAAEFLRRVLVPEAQQRLRRRGFVLVHVLIQRQLVSKRAEVSHDVVARVERHGTERHRGRARRRRRSARARASSQPPPPRRPRRRRRARARAREAAGRPSCGAGASDIARARRRDGAATARARVWGARARRWMGWTVGARGTVNADARETREAGERAETRVGDARGRDDGMMGWFNDARGVGTRSEG